MLPHRERAEFELSDDIKPDFESLFGQLAVLHFANPKPSKVAQQQLNHDAGKAEASRRAAEQARKQQEQSNNKK